MFGLLSQQSKLNVMAEETIGNTGGGPFIDQFGLSGGNLSSPSTLNFDFDISQIKQAAAKGKGSEADIRSAYELFSTGQTSGRAYGYATDIQRRFTPGLLSTYGSADIRTAAANYLDSVGLARLSQIVSPVPTPVVEKPKETTPVDSVLPKNPFELLIDAFQRSFGNAVYNPPLQSQSSGFTGQTTDVPLSEAAGGSNIGTFIIIGVVGVIAYFLYKRFAG
jgi:hypothetical protein